jgi:hypothetical protein
MANGTDDRELIPPNPGPSLAISGEDAEDMKRAMRGVTTSRSEGMAHVEAQRQMARAKKRSSRRR